jgi:ribosomal protein S18 acetylase RimI-like enzyme
MSLQPFDTVQADVVASWAVGRDVVRAWCAVDDATVPAEMVAGWSDADDVEAFLFIDESGQPVAYGELWVDKEEGEVELARLLVRPERRGTGVGRTMVRALADRAREVHPELPSVFLRVRPDNEPALHCYRAAGFQSIPEHEQASWNKGQRFAYHWMTAAQ